MDDTGTVRKEPGRSRSSIRWLAIARFVWGNRDDRDYDPPGICRPDKPKRLSREEMPGYSRSFVWGTVRKNQGRFLILDSKAFKLFVWPALLAWHRKVAPRRFRPLAWLTRIVTEWCMR